MKRKHLLLMAAIAFVVGLLAQSLYAVATEAGDQPARDRLRGGGDVGALAVGADSGDLKFVPIDPCRVIDTRSAGGALTPDETRAFYISGDFGFDTQGGTSGGCGIPFPTAVAVTLNLTAVDPNGKGFMRAWPYDEPVPAVPNATILNYSTALNASNAATVAICDRDAGGACNFDLLVKNFTNTSHLVVDAFGYFVEPMFAVVTDGGTLVGGSRVVGVTHTGTGRYTVEFDRFIHTCGFATTTRGSTGEVLVSVGAGNASVLVQTRDSGGTFADRTFDLVALC